METRLTICRLILAVAALLACFAAPASAGVVVEEFRVPMAEAGPEGLEAILVRPETPGRHPLALVSHGSPRRSDERPGMSVRGLLPELTEFARRGFLAAAVLRRGYGSSPGGWTDSYGPCDNPTYLKAGRAGAMDLRAAIAALSRRPDVDPTRILAIGISAGGFATVALSADPPPGVVAGISFAGGRGSQGPEDVCHDEVLVDAFKAFGRRSRIPMLWVYAQNDHFFDPPLARRLLAAFNGTGGQAEFNAVPAFGTEGHLLFTPAGRALWLPILDAYLKRHGLMPASALRPVAAKLDAPRQLGAAGREAFTSFLAAASHKAFAVDANGAYAWRTGRNSRQDAENSALESCRSLAHTPCRLYAVDDSYSQPR